MRPFDPVFFLKKQNIVLFLLIFVTSKTQTIFWLLDRQASLLTADAWAGIVWTGMLTDLKSYTKTFPRLVPTIKAVPSGTKSIDVIGASASIFFIILIKFENYVVTLELM